MSLLAIGSGLLMTQSRSALAAVLLSLTAMGVYRHRWLRMASIPIVLLACIMVWRLLTATSGPVGDAVAELSLVGEGRMELWLRASYLVRDFPFTGVGLGSFGLVTDLLYPSGLYGPQARMPHPHNLFLDVAASCGIPGYTAFLAILGGWGMMTKECLLHLRVTHRDRHAEDLVVGLAGGIIAYLVFGFTDSISLGEKAGAFYWLVLGLTVLIWRGNSRDESCVVDAR